MLDFPGAVPPERAEWALASWLVFFLSVPLELLDPSKLSLARRAGRFHLHLGAHATVTVVSGILFCCMFSSLQKLSLENIINIHSNHGKPNGACLIG